MSLTSIRSLFSRVASTQISPLLYASTWTFLLIVTAVMATLAPMFAFKLAISQPSSSSSNPCYHVGYCIRIPLDFPREMVYLPQQAIRTRSNIDFFLPTLFAALVVAASTCLLRAVMSRT
ncbi:hypothetical protein Lalb_Chr03g0026781 [Lupinus albus]|uniref:Uncharacterized protein n=1 Tax=Lupinus albus TaxID=3870 RepID=A0A6A4QSW7_LUPAL|nr:hypothetical protein Lalb_Chr03g0026781 [Lupinus albus]